jgi:hypothetical protein
VEGRALQPHHLESGGGDELPQGAGGVEPQMSDHLLSRAAVDRAQADLGEHGLHPGEQQGAVVPGGQVRRGEHQMAARAQHPADLVECRVRVDQMLDDLAEQHGVGATGPERQPPAGEFTPDRVRQTRTGAGEGVLGPVDADDAVAVQQGGGGGGGGAVAAADVEDGARRAGGRTESGGQHPGLAEGARGAGGDGDGRVLVEVAQVGVVCRGGGHGVTSVACR